MIKRGRPLLPGNLPGIDDINHSGMLGIDASIFPTFQVRSAMPQLPVKPAAPTRASGTSNVVDARPQNGQPNSSSQPTRQSGK